jgi:hypothetical protein
MMNCPMMPGQARPGSAGAMPGQTQGMGPGMMHRQMQAGRAGAGGMGPGQMVFPPPGNQ